MKAPVLFAAALTLAAVTPAAASQIFDPSTSTCTTANCSMMIVGGATNSIAGATAGPWSAEIFANTGNCMRLFVTTQNADLEIVAVSPNGTVFRNDDGGGNNRPLVKINNTARGFYTVHVGTWNGAALEADFNLGIGLYNGNNPNCASPTPPTLVNRAAGPKSGDNGPRVTGGPSAR